MQVDLRVKCSLCLQYQLPRECVLWELSFSIRTDGQTEGRTEKTKILVAFSNRYANAPLKKFKHATAGFQPAVRDTFVNYVLTCYKNTE
jgi:hypothetical protein